MPLAAFTSPPELSHHGRALSLEVVPKCKEHLVVTTLVFRHNLGTALGLPIHSPCAPTFPKEPSLESSHQLSHSPGWVASSQVILHSVVFLSSERELKGMESVKQGSRHPVSATQELIPFLERAVEGREHANLGLQR